MTARVGAQVIPVPAGAEVRVLDPLVEGLLDYLAWWIVWGFGAQGVRQRPTGATAITNVLPTANRFPYDPRDTWLRDPRPALYLWWPNRQQSRVRRFSATQDVRERQLRLMYALAEVQHPDGARVYSGLVQAIEAIVIQAASDGYHPEYGYSGAPAGTPIADSLAPLGMVGWEYVGGAPDFIAVKPVEAARAVGGPAGGHIHRGFPVYLGVLRVLERIELYATPSEQMPDVATTLTHDGVTVVEGYLPGPDGSEGPEYDA